MFPNVFVIVVESALLAFIDGSSARPLSFGNVFHEERCRTPTETTSSHLISLSPQSHLLQ
jgi:hypothetical protein